jgi:hypothetical protein
MKIYIDSEKHCHTTNPDGIYREVEHPFFDDKRQIVVEGYCYDDSKGYVQIYPWKPYDELDAAQREYERQMLAEYEESLKVMGVIV